MYVYMCIIQTYRSAWTGLKGRSSRHDAGRTNFEQACSRETYREPWHEAPAAVPSIVAAALHRILDR